MYFEKGELKSVNEKCFEEFWKVIVYFNEIVKFYVIGCDIYVGDMIIGIKGRVGFEVVVFLIILKVYYLIEKYILIKW